ncbi:MAG: hypothetical protein AAGI38_19245 [Bacteroidota bacterium]
MLILIKSNEIDNELSRENLAGRKFMVEDYVTFVSNGGCSTIVEL